MTGRRVVVTGIGTINPLGNSIEEYFSNLEKGVSGAAPITHFDAEKFKTKFACEVKNYDPTQYFDRKEVRKYDLFTQYALIAATQAVEDSALDLEKVDKEQVGVIWSSGIGGIKSFFDECLGWAAGDGTPRFSPFFIPRMISDIAAGFISMKYGFMGPNYCTVSACASSNHGMMDAMNAMMGTMMAVLVAIAAISLLVGGIGIMNIMLVTVTERTREIGIRRAIGAERSSIVIQFLIEAAMLCGIGGIIGILIGTGGSLLVGRLMFQMTIYPAAWITLCAFTLSVALGILFGIYPAAKAARLQPVEALRAE